LKIQTKLPPGLAELKFTRQTLQLEMNLLPLMVTAGLEIVGATCAMKMTHIDEKAYNKRLEI